MQDLLGKICSAIAQQEGFFSRAVNRPREDHNPGDLRGAPWLPHPTLDDGYWKATSDAMGIGGLYHQVALDISRGLTLRQLLNEWAPVSDGNQPSVYLEDVMRWTEISTPDVPLWNLLEIHPFSN